MRKLDFYLDFRSPYSYLAYTQLASLDADVTLIPITILEVMKLVGNMPTTVTCAVKRTYAGKDLQRWASRYKVPFARPEMARLDGIALARIATAAGPLGMREPVVTTIFGAVWGASGDASPEGVAGLLTDAGLPAADLLAAADTPRAAEALTKANSDAAALGVFGAPTFCVDGELFFGNDRIEFVREALSAQRRGA